MFTIALLAILAKTRVNAVADPGFPRGGGVNPPGGGREHTIFPKFPENCMNLDAQRWGCIPHASPLDPPIEWDVHVNL